MHLYILYSNDRDNNILASSPHWFIYLLCSQTCRTLLEQLAVDKHIYVRVFDEPVPVAPTTFQSLLKQHGHCKEPSKCRRRYFANPTSTFQL